MSIRHIALSTPQHSSSSSLTNDCLINEVFILILFFYFFTSPLWFFPLEVLLTLSFLPITTLGSYLHQLPQTYYNGKIGQVMLKSALFQILLTSFKLSDYEHSTPLFENLSDCTDYKRSPNSLTQDTKPCNLTPQQMFHHLDSPHPHVFSWILNLVPLVPETTFSTWQNPSHPSCTTTHKLVSCLFFFFFFYHICNMKTILITNRIWFFQRINELIIEKVLKNSAWHT